VYVLSFAFASEGNAQIVLLGITFMQISLMPLSNLTERLFFETEVAGDRKVWFYRMFPMFPIGQAIIEEALIEELAKTRETIMPENDGGNIDTNLWSI
jgi:hypothetical protein